MEQIAGSIESYDNEDFDSMTKKELEIIQESMVDIIGLCQSLKTKVDNIIATK